MANVVSETIRKEYNFNELAEIEKFEDMFRDRYYSRLICKTGRLKRKLGHSGVLYLLRASQRAKFLYNDFLDTINRKNVIAAYLIARAHLETTAALGYFFYNLKRHYDGTITYDDLEIVLGRLGLGYKGSICKDNPEIPEAVNVMTMLNALNKVLELEYPLQFFEYLSEKCHPNCEGTSFGAKHIKQGQSIVFFSDKADIKREELQKLIVIVIFSCAAFIELFDKCLSLLIEREQIPTLVKALK